MGFSAFIDDQDRIDEIVEIVIKRFDLIMISDYMDESQVSMNLALVSGRTLAFSLIPVQSLILLKDELGLEMEDILYFTINKMLVKIMNLTVP